MYSVNKYLTPEERLTGIRFGFMSKLAENGITPGMFEKRASGIISDTMRAIGGTLKSAPGFLKDALQLSLVTGIPAGVIWHAVDRSSRKGSADVERLRKQRDYYNDIIADIEKKVQE